MEGLPDELLYCVMSYCTDVEVVWLCSVKRAFLQHLPCHAAKLVDLRRVFELKRRILCYLRAGEMLEDGDCGRYSIYVELYGCVFIANRKAAMDWLLHTERVVQFWMRFCLSEGPAFSMDKILIHRQPMPLVLPRRWYDAASATTGSGTSV